MSLDAKGHPVRLGSDPPPEGSQSADNYEAPTRVGESAYAILARSMTEDAIVPDAAAHAATTARPPAPAAGTPPTPPEAVTGTEEALAAAPSGAPTAGATRAAEARAEIAIAVGTFLAVAIPAVLYVMYLR